MAHVTLETAKGLNVTRVQSSIDALGKKSWEQQVALCQKLAAVANEAKEKKVKTEDWAARIKVPTGWYKNGGRHLAKLLKIGRASANDMSQYLGTLTEGQSASILGCYQALGALAKGKDPKESGKKKKDFLFVGSITKAGAEKFGIESGSIKLTNEGFDSNLSTADIIKLLKTLLAGVQK